MSNEKLSFKIEFLYMHIYKKKQRWQWKLTKLLGTFLINSNPLHRERYSISGWVFSNKLIQFFLSLILDLEWRDNAISAFRH